MLPLNYLFLNPCISIARLLLVFILLAFSVLVNAEDSTHAVAQLHVRGEAQLMVAPDQVAINLGVTSEAKKAKQAMEDNSQKMANMVRVLTGLGLTDKEYETQNFSIQPVWSSRPRNADQEWRAKITGYRVSNTLRVSTTKMELIGDVIEQSTDAGANQVHSLHFSLSNPREYRAQAITQAMKNAKEDAQTLVAASGDTISRTLSLRLDNAVASQTHVEVKAKRSRLMQASAAMADSVAPPINAGDITVRASVSVTYELNGQ